MTTRKTARAYLKSSYPGHSQAYLGEFMGYFESLKTDEDRIRALKEFLQEQAGSKLKLAAYRAFLECLVYPQCKLNVPPGIPDGIKFHTAPDQVAGSIWKTMGSISYFIPNTANYIGNDIKRERIFLQFVEGMCESDARLLVAMKDQDMGFVPGLTQKVLHEAYPGWIAMPDTKMVAAKKAVDSVIKETKEALAPKRKAGRPLGSKNKKKPDSPPPSMSGSPIG